MPTLTAKVPGNGTSTNSYTIPVSGLDVESVYAAIDASGAGGAVTAELTITDESGVVIARKVQNTTIDQGVSGSATWALQLDDDCLAVAPTLPFPQLVLGLRPVGQLRGYWRLGDAAAPWLDSSGWAGGPTPLTVSGAGAAPTLHVAGALPAAEDDGAVQGNGGPGTGQYLHNASGAINNGINSNWSICGWVKPFPSASTWVANIYNNIASSAGLTSGWAMAIFWLAGNVYAETRRFINNASIQAYSVIPTNTWTFIVSTYDGATLRLYVNGAIAATAADARADTFVTYSNVDLITAVIDPGTPVGTISGAVDEVAIWGSVLTASEIASLYAAGL